MCQEKFYFMRLNFINANAWIDLVSEMERPCIETKDGPISWKFG